MVEREAHRRLREHARATGRKIEWLATHLITRGLETSESK
jgi:AmiR/NasT family two-component response regulator